MVPCQNIFGKNEKQEPKESHVNNSLRFSRRIFEIKNCLYNFGRELFDYGFYCGKDEKGVLIDSEFLKWFDRIKITYFLLVAPPLPLTMGIRNTDSTQKGLSSLKKSRLRLHKKLSYLHMVPIQPTENVMVRKLHFNI